MPYCMDLCILTACNVTPLRCNGRLEILQVFEEDTGKGKGIPPELAHDLYEFMKLLASHPAEDTADLQRDSFAFKASRFQFHLWTSWICRRACICHPVMIPHLHNDLKQ